jgi:alanine dehydrogenase
MPGAVPHTSTHALTNVTIRPALEIASKGIESAVRSSPHLAAGINVWDGACTMPAVAESHGLPCTPLEKIL